jgi:DNA-binding response OmpR family regulator
MAESRLKIILIGGNETLAYLIGRFAERSGTELTLLPTAPTAEEACRLRPAVILFASIERLEAAQSLISELANCEIPVLVCSSVADETRAREMGADHCLAQPLTYDGFLAAMPLQ